MIRDARHEDIPAIVAMGARFFAEAEWSDVTEWDDDSVSVTLANLIEGEGGILLVAEKDGRLVGMTGGLVHPAYFNIHHLTGQELFWWVAPEWRKGIGAEMFHRLEHEAKMRGAQSWSMIALDRVRPKAMDRVYKVSGYRCSEHSYIKRL